MEQPDHILELHEVKSAHADFRHYLQDRLAQSIDEGEEFASSLQPLCEFRRASVNAYIYNMYRPIWMIVTKSETFWPGALKHDYRWPLYSEV